MKLVNENSFQDCIHRELRFFSHFCSLSAIFAKRSRSRRNELGKHGILIDFRFDKLKLELAGAGTVAKLVNENFLPNEFGFTDVMC